MEQRMDADYLAGLRAKVLQGTEVCGTAQGAQFREPDQQLRLEFDQLN
jgi:hypothetical protein